MSKRLLSLHRQAPGTEAKEALDAVLVAGVFEQQVSLLFRGAGVCQLASDQVTDEFVEAVASLPDYGIEAIYVCGNSLHAAGLTAGALLVPATLLTPAEQGELLRQQDMVLCD